jgi:YHS domain-containing protein
MRTTGIAIATFAFAAALVAAVPGCRNNNGADDQQPTTQHSTDGDSATASAEVTSEQASAGQPVNKNCAVEQEHPADPTVTYMHDGKVYGFCCEDCIDAFKKDPAKYADAK